MTDETPQDREDRITQRILAIGALIIAGGIGLALMLKEIPEKNEVILGTVVGFLFGNMIGPVYRKVFGGADPETRKVQAAQNDTLSKTIDRLAATPAEKPLVVEAPATVTVEPAPSDETSR